MTHNYPNILVHCVFSTKNRLDSIPDDLREKLSMYFVGIGKGHNIPVLCAGGTRNHVHIGSRMNLCRYCGNRTSRMTHSLFLDDTAERGVPDGTVAIFS